ncbi:MAG: transposase [Pseudomonadota bacterium]|nr:transposase [Pseudomonadota bacterium]
MKAPTSDELSQLAQTIARFAALVPEPRVNPTRFHGVFIVAIQLVPFGTG